ncbi:hypothetical protein [Flavobacterium sp. ZS1P14]|uniref:hypothetical protein n=1 Tax=Flavobacterium sp. ZS1P14 TaxID=3401729 RepID=UPI003AAAC868
MKNCSLCLVILPLLIVSCTADTIDTTAGSNTKVSNNKLEKSTRLVQKATPENPENVYDIAGKLHNEILDIYLTGNYHYTTIVQISEQVEAIATKTSDSRLLDLKTNLPISIEELEEIVNKPEAELDEAIANSSMTSAAKRSLCGFMNAVVLWKNDEYAKIYQSIISYESSVMTNPQFSSEDKRIILTASSITRYSLYDDTGRRDKDWEASVGNLVGGVKGAFDQSSRAVKMALIIGISQNNHIRD